MSGERRKTMATLNFGGDYYSQAVGFVLHGEVFCDRNAAEQYLVDIGMEYAEAESYMNRLERAFRKHVMSAIGKGVGYYG